MGRIDRIISESINRFVNEAFQSQILRDLNKKTPSDVYGRRFHGGEDFSHKTVSDAEAHGLPGAKGLYSSGFLDKITDDMIDVVGTRDELRESGFRFGSHKTWYGIGSQEVYDANGDRRYTMILRNGTFVVFKNDPETISKLRQMSTEAGEKYNRRQANKYGDGSKRYQWSTWNRGNAFDEWKNTGRGLWDNPNFKTDHDVSNWRQDSWVKRNMDNALDSYKRK